MPIDTTRVETITFDSFTTLVDVLSTTTRELGKYVDSEETISDIASLWRFRAVEYRMLCNSMEEYETYEGTTRDALEYALADNDVDLIESEIDDLVAQFHELDVYDDVYETMRRLDDREYDLYIISNGNPELLNSMVSQANIGEFIVDTVSADDIETYKPDIEFYRHAVNVTDTPADNIAHVATPWYDIYGANNAGMQSVWVNRNDKPWETFDGSPDAIITALDELPPIFE